MRTESGLRNPRRAPLGGVPFLGALAAPSAALLLAGCAAADWSKEPLPVSVSAANYSQVSGEELYAKVNARPNTEPSVPQNPVPTHPIFYAFVPGAIYPSNVPFETVQKELATALAHRGYFNVVYQIKAGLKPDRVDYLLRLNFGERPWKTPTVRTDAVTWGDSGLTSTWGGANQGSNSVHWIGPLANWDPREGMSPAEAGNIAEYYGRVNGWGSDMSVRNRTVEDASHSDFALIMVEAFRIEDVARMKDRAPCVWATFVAVKLHQGQDFGTVLRTMAEKATPYFGNTTNGLQVYEVPPGKVIMGEPVEVAAPQKQP